MLPEECSWLVFPGVLRKGGKEFPKFQTVPQTSASY